MTTRRWRPKDGLVADYCCDGYRIFFCRRTINQSSLEFVVLVSFIVVAVGVSVVLGGVINGVS